jgi:hypothetical protein
VTTHQAGRRLNRTAINPELDQLIQGKAETDWFARSILRMFAKGGKRSPDFQREAAQPTTINSGKTKNGQASAVHKNQNRTGASARSGGQLRPAALFRRNQNLPDQAVLAIIADTQSQPATKIAVQT